MESSTTPQVTLVEGRQEQVKSSVFFSFESAPAMSSSIFAGEFTNAKLFCAIFLPTKKQKNADRFQINFTQER